jgi:hypothetical protein
MLHILLLGVLAGQAGNPAARQPPAPSELRIVVAAPVYQPDGGVTAETTTLTEGAPTVVHVYSRRSLCETAIAGAAEPADAGFGWRVTSQTVRVTDSIVNVSVDWRRVWDRGRKIANGPSGTVQLKLYPGARVPLDHIPNPAATDACRAVGLGLEVRLARTAPPAPVNSSLVPLGASPGGASPIDADLWLVQRMPSGVEQVNHQTVRLDTNGGSFSFSPVKVSGERGEVDVEIGGSFKRFRAPVGGEFLYLSLTRAITGESMPPGGFRGGTGTMIPLPGPAEVLALEIPTPGAAPAAGGRGGPRGGGGGARSRGAGGGDPQALPPPLPQGSQVGAVAGGFARGREGGQPVPPSALSPQALEILKGHLFSVRVRFTPVPGM